MAVIFTFFIQYSTFLKKQGDPKAGAFRSPEMIKTFREEVEISPEPLAD